jgi:hypothetical protein
VSTLTSTPTMPSPFESPPVHRITVDEYERIIAAGALEDPGGVELIDGTMVDKMGKNAEHGYATKQGLKARESRLPLGWTWRKEEPVRTPTTMSRSRTSRSSGALMPITNIGSIPKHGATGTIRG